MGDIVATKLAPEEREIAITQSAEDRANGVWHIYCDDPYWQRRLDKIATLIRPASQGQGKYYEVGQGQIILSKTRPPHKPTPQGQFQNSDGTLVNEPSRHDGV